MTNKCDCDGKKKKKKKKKKKNIGIFTNIFYMENI